MPGTDAAYLAMDMEDGVEVIWNEVTFADRKEFEAKEKQMMTNLDSLMAIAHPNIVKVSSHNSVLVHYNCNESTIVDCKFTFVNSNIKKN